MIITGSDMEVQIGNKAKHLFTLKHLGYTVPAFCVLAYADLKKMAIGNELEITDALLSEIGNYFGECDSFAVRSSANVEDSAGKSFAGQFSTKLNVKKEDLKNAIREVWLSPFQNHVNTYNAEGVGIEISVIVQHCVEADVSGVVFSADPMKGDMETSVVSCVYGLGEGLVSGALDADLFYVKGSEITDSIIAEKSEKMVYGPHGDLKKEGVDEDVKNKASLNDLQVIEIAGVSRELEIHFGAPQDIEFCIKNNQLYLLQSRPVTAFFKGNKDYLVWDNSNIIESYPGITLPLTFSFISPVYASVYRQFCGILGVGGKLIEANEFTFDNMLGLLKGRVYYNLYSWYKLLSLLPGYSLNAGFMEKMMGVSEKFELKDYRKPNGFIEKLRVGKLVFSMVKNAVQLNKMSRRFLMKFNRVLEEHKLLDIQHADAGTCMMSYYEFEKTLAKEWKAPLVNDFFAMIYYGLFQKFADKHSKDSEINFNQFLIHTGKVITTEPAILQQQISLIIQGDVLLNTLFEEKGENEIWSWINANKGHQVSVLIFRYLEKWGNRCFEELKLETITYSQDPLLFIRLIKNTYRHAQPVRENKLLFKEPRMGWLNKRIFNFLKRNAIRTVTSRENLRFERTRAFAEVRFIFCRIGEIFYKENVITNARDIFYLSKEEIFNFIKGTSIQLNLKDLIALRKSEYDIYRKESPQASRIKTTGIVYNEVFETEKSGTDFLLKGLPCCPGIVRAPVKIIHSPADIEDLEGKILVTVSTDPGWVSVFPLVKGILVQRGSVLSHAAIVSREMNIPCIVGIKNITTMLKNDTLIEMNGATGEIKIIEG